MHQSARARKTRKAYSTRIEDLEEHGVSPDVLDIWQQTVGPELLPVQSRAVRECGLLSDAGHLIVFAPTSSGKTFIGEMAAVKAADARAKVFYLVPQKALAEEKYREFKARYARLNMNVAVSSSDHREHDDRIVRGEFDIAVVVFEKLQILLIRRPELINQVGLVVIDELQLITDKERGPALELLLTKLRLAPSKPRILGLSAVLGGADALARWLGARLLVDEQRPVELRKGVLSRGEFRYVEHNTGEEGVEAFNDVRSDTAEELILAAAQELAGRGEQSIVFVPDPKTTVALARKLATRLGLPVPAEALAELAQEEETQNQRALQEVIAGGVGFHNAELSFEERRIVERHFRSGGLRVLFSTGTLAVGMNLPAKNVIMDRHKWGPVAGAERPGRVEVTKSEYENMSGRAGRFHLETGFGRSILVTANPVTAQSLRRDYTSGDFEAVEPRLGGEPLEDAVLNLLTSGLATNRIELENVLLETFTGHVTWRGGGQADFALALKAAIDVCVKGELVTAHEDGRLAVSEIGRACALKGLEAATALAFVKWVKLAKGKRVKALEILTMIGGTKAGEKVHIKLSRAERQEKDYRRLLFQKLKLSQVADRKLFGAIADTRMAIAYKDARAVKKALLLFAWIHEEPTPDIERTYPLASGKVRKVGADYARLVEGLGAVAGAFGLSAESCRIFEVLAERLVHGVQGDLLPLARMRVPSLRRSHMRRLLAAGLADEAALRAAGAAAIRALLDHDTAFKALAAHLELPPEETVKAEPEPVSPAPAADVPSPAVPVPPAASSAFAQRGMHVDTVTPLVFFRGTRVPTRPPNNLQPQALIALACLAENHGKTVAMTELARVLEMRGVLQKNKAVPAAKELRNRITRPFKEALPSKLRSEIAKLIRVVRSGLVLRVPGDLVQVVWPEGVVSHGDDAQVEAAPAAAE